MMDVPKMRMPGTCGPGMMYEGAESGGVTLLW
jgi:hypothetical protein